MTLITDFGLRDEYVGVLKGVILATAPAAAIVDICHAIAPQDIAGAAHMLDAAYPFFPGGTVHAAVVDPGVGTRRSIICAQAGGHRFVAPDNGLLWPVLRTSDSPVIHRVENEKLYRHPVSGTFHGRDIIAPVAAHLAAGFPLADVGPAVALKDIVALDDLDARWISSCELEGRVIGIDRFGNLLTNIRATDLTGVGPGEPRIVVGETEIAGLRQTYAQGLPGKPMALWSSRDTLEIAVKEASAADLLNLEKGAVVRVKARRK